MSELESARVLAQVKMALLKYTSFVFLEVLSKTWPPIVKTKVSACTLWCFPFVFQTDVGIPYWNLHGNWEWVRMNLLKEIHLSFFWKSCQKPGLQSWKRRFLSACTLWCFPSALQRDIGIPHWNLHGNWGRGGQNATIDIALGNWSLSLFLLPVPSSQSYPQTEALSNLVESVCPSVHWVTDVLNFQNKVRT